MSYRRRRHNPEPPAPRQGLVNELPSLKLLDQFSEQSIRQWLASARAIRDLQTELFFGLEIARQRCTQQLVDAVRKNLAQGNPFSGWARIIDYRYCLEPLSIAGSLKGDGGRFNIGADLNPAAFPAFPALYLAEDYPTAFSEKFGEREHNDSGAMTMPELGLRATDSFAHVAVQGQIELVLDVGELGPLQPFANILSKFALPNRVRLLARHLNWRNPPGLIRSATTLQRHLLHPNWRMLPLHFDLPSNSQVFGRIAAAAGVHAIKYPSSRQSRKYCLALFPQNWKDSTSFVEVSDASPPGARLLRIDGTTSLFQ